MVKPKPGEIWRWNGQYKNTAPSATTILLLSKDDDPTIDGLIFTGHAFETGDTRQWWFTETNMSRWQKLA